MGIHIKPETTNEKLFVFEHIITFTCEKGIIVPADFTLEQAIEYAKENMDKMFIPPCTSEMDFLSDELDFEACTEVAEYFPDSVRQEVFVDLKERHSQPI